MMHLAEQMNQQSKTYTPKWHFSVLGVFASDSCSKCHC